jgi:hypothetical protein
MVMVKLFVGPTQLPMEGVMVMVAVTAETVGFVPVKVGVPPVPLAAKPIDVVEFVQAYVAPDGVLVKLTAPTLVPLQAIVLPIASTTGFGLIVISNSSGVALHPLAVAFTVMVPVIGVEELFVPVNDGMVAVEPLPPKPMAVLELSQVTDALAGITFTDVAETVELVQTVISEIADIVGVGLIVIE